MSKTLGSILSIAAVVAIQFVPGVGQALTGVLGAAFSGTAIGGGITAFGYAAATVTSSIITAGLTIAGLSSLAGLFAPNAPKPEQTQSPLKQARPPRVSAYGRSRLYGAYILFETAPDGTAVDVYAMHDGQIDGIEAYYLGDEAVTLTGSVVNTGSDGRYRDSTVRIYTTTGETPGNANMSVLISLLPGLWTSNHRGDGVMIAVALFKSVKAAKYQETYPNGLPPPLSIAARWQRVFDWRDEAQSVESPGTWTWSENPVLQTAHYQLVRNNKDWDTHFAPTLDLWTAAADDCDIAVPLKAGGTEPRYRSSVAHKHTDEHKAVLGSLVATFDGWMAPRADGALAIYSGRYYEPTVSIGPDEIVSYSWQDGIDDEQAVNELIVGYISAEHDFNSVETDAWTDEGDIAARGAIRSTPIENQVPSHAQARRLAKRYMAKVMAQKRGSVTTNSAGRNVRGERYINLHIEEAGAIFFSGPAEVTALTRSLGTGGVTFSWIAADPEIDAWSPATEEGDPAALGDRVVLEPLAAPTIDSATANFDAGYCRIEVDGDGPARDDLTWYARTRLAGESAWTEAQFTDTAVGSPVGLMVGPVSSDASVELEIAYEVGDGRISPWSITSAVDTGEPINPATDLNAADGVGQSVVGWKNPVAGPFSYARVYRGTTASFGAATQRGGDISGGLGATMSYTDAATAGTWYYWVRAFAPDGSAAAATGPESAIVT